MLPQRWEQVERLYYAALERAPADRAQFLHDACACDAGIRLEVESLLASGDWPAGFMESLPGDLVARILAGRVDVSAAAPSAVAVQSPTAIGSYRILRLLGEGGMGAVYEAEQQTPHRVVALKIIKPGFATPDVLRRFEQEANALGMLQHPGIAQIYEAGTADTGSGPQPYFAMELIRGQSLLEHIEAHGSTADQRLELIARICDAAHHAHQRGIVHRDLKPGNILVDQSGQPKILDFGVARVTGDEMQRTRQTDLGQLLGTLSYMSPEQVTGDPQEVDARSDVYSLGVILYQLLAGRLPYPRIRNLHEFLRAVREEVPAPLGALNRRYRGDIENITAKALEKEKVRRYASAADFATDIRHYLADEPIVARPPGAAYQLRKFARRHKAVVFSVALLFVVLVAGIISSSIEAMRANRAGSAALAERDRAASAERTATAERDRATVAERVAREERDRALGAERVATSERNRSIAEKERADRESNTAKAVNDFLLNDLLAQAVTSAQAGAREKPDPDLKVRTALDRAAARIAGRFQDRPLVEASIRQTIGDTYRELGLYPEAERQIARAVELRTRLLGKEHPDTLFSMNRLGEAYIDQGKYQEAERLFGGVLEARRRVLGANNVETLNTMSNLADVNRHESKYPDAERLNATVLERELHVLGERHPETLNTLGNLAQLYVDQGKYPNAEEVYVKLLDIDGRAPGEGYPRVLLDMDSLAQVYRREGKYAQAEGILVKLLDMERRTLGPQHPNTASTMNDLALVYRYQGKYTSAEDLFTRSLEIHTRLLGEEHPSTLTVMKNLATVYRDEAKYAQAESLFDKVLEVRRRVLGEGHRDTLISMSDSAVLYRDQGSYDKAESTLSQVVEAWRRLLGPEHPNTLSSKDNLAVVLGERGKYSQGESMAMQVIEGRRKVLGVEHPETLRSMNNLAVLYRAAGKDSAAESLFGQVLQTRRRVLGERQPDTLTTMYDLALLYEHQGKYKEAALLLSQVLDLRRSISRPQHRETLNALAELGRIHLQQRSYPEAEPFEREALTGYEKIMPESWRRFDAQSLLGGSLAGQNQFIEAEPVLVSAYQAMLQRQRTIPAESLSRLEQSGARVVQLYEHWRKPDQATEWRKRLVTDLVKVAGTGR